MDAPDNLASKWLAKVFSLEFVFSAALALFVGGGAWNSLQSSIAEAQTSADASAQKAAEVNQAVQGIQTDVEVIKTRLESASEIQKQQTKELAEQRKDIKQILTLLVEKDKR